VPLGDFVAVLAIREDQRNKADERVAMSFKKARGEIPFGYRLAADGVHVEADAKEQAILTRMRALSQQKGPRAAGPAPACAEREYPTLSLTGR